MKSLLSGLTPRRPEIILTDLKDLKYLPAATVFRESGLKLAIPDNVIRLLQRARNGEPRYVKFLGRMLGIQTNPDTGFDSRGTKMISKIQLLFDTLGEWKLLITISDDDVVNEIRDAFEGSFESSLNYISLSPRRNFVREYFVKVCSFASKTRAVIATTSAEFFNRAGRYVSALQLRDQLNAIVEEKQAFVNKFWRKAGGPYVKYFVGAFITGAGFAASPPIGIGVAGAILSFSDP